MDPDALDRALAEAFGGERSAAGRTRERSQASRERSSRSASRASSDEPPDGSQAAERRVVVRQALDLADAGRWAETHDGAALTVERVVAALEQAPDGEGLADRWNWWIGSLEVAYGGFERFAVRRWRAE